MAIKGDADARIEALIESAKDDEILHSDEEFTGISFDDQLKALPDDAKKLLANMRRDYTQKTQALASQRADLAAQQKSLFESDAFKTLQEMSQREMGEFDPYNPDSVLNHIKKQVADEFSNILKPMHESQIQERKRAKLDSFMTANPDLKTDQGIRSQVKDLLMSNESLDMESAYWIVKGQALTTENARHTEELGRYKSAVREAGLKVSGGTKTNARTKPPGDLNAFEIYQWYERQKASRS
tara:strand:- start:399 stop:1121 length:723 start_codon:yes stop_codon:yes gene_type:complete